MSDNVDKLTYKATWGGLFRIGLWAIVFIYITNLFLPRQPLKFTQEEYKATTESQVIHMMVNFTETNLDWVRDDFDQFPTNLKPKIAWIAGSSANIKNNLGINTVLPVLVDDIFKSEGGSRPYYYFYAYSARRILDTYNLVLDALERKPDMLVLTINPFWDFNNKAVFYQSNAFSEGANVWWKSGDWFWQLVLVPPSEHFGNFIGKYIPFIVSPTNYQNTLEKESTIFFRTNTIEWKEYVPVTDIKSFKVNQPLFFWINYKFNPGGLNFKDDGTNLLVFQLEVMKAIISGSKQNTWPYEIWQKILRDIQDSNIPTLIYLAPVSPKLLETQQAHESYLYVLDSMRSLQSSFESPNITFVIQFPDEVKNTLVFRDYLHLSRAGDLPNYFVDEIKNLLGEADATIYH